MERFIKFFLFFLFIVSSIDASYIQWYSDYESAHKKARQENKKLLVVLTSEKNSKIINEVFINQPYIEMINKNFIAVYLMKNQKNGYPIELLYTLEYPTVFFLDRYELYSCEPIYGVLNSTILEKKLYECNTNK